MITASVRREANRWINHNELLKCNPACHRPLAKHPARAAAVGSIRHGVGRWRYPFAALGIGIGYLVSPRVAVPVANLVYLPLLYVGGL